MANELRRLWPEEWRAFRDLRLTALLGEPGVFSSTYDREVGFEEDQWRVRLSVGAAFGLFDGGGLVGFTYAYTDRDDPDGTTAGLAMSYLLPAYRARGLASDFYAARLAWARSLPSHRRVVTAHRASNAASRRAMERHGFRKIGERAAAWPDGGEEEEWLYELTL